MGRNKRKKVNSKKGSDPKKPKSETEQDKGENQEKKDNGVWKTIVKYSEKFVNYYKGLGIVPENEFDQFIVTLQTPLPTTFRITSTRQFAPEIKRSLVSQFSEMPEIKLDDGTTATPPRPIVWYPDNGAWVFNASRKAIRRTPELEAFHKFMIVQNEFGNITRQEAVSMIPPLLLKVEPHHKVLDMCAAPGSKTGQIIEFLHANDKEKPPTGMVIANDADYNRCYTLTHQIKRLGSHCMLITTHEAQAFPYVKKDPESGDVVNEGTNRYGKIDLQFDRVLCDVPCSGDGTLRKNPELWTRWSPSFGIGLHVLQIKITLRGAQLLKTGGRMVYSTCSLNPVEDEAVVAQILRHSKGALRLVDVSKELPNLKRSNGINQWRVQDADGTWYANHGEVKEIRKKKLPASMFPPTEEEAKAFGLHHCMRILPHSQDTGGFFICVIEKVASMFPPQQQQQQSTSSTSMEGSEKKETTEEDKTEEPTDEELRALDLTTESNSKKTKKGWIEDPFLPFPKDMLPTWETIKKFYGLSDNFPLNQVIVRSEKSLKMYFVSPGVSQFLDCDDKKVVRIVNTGVKLFAKTDAKDMDYECQYRVCQEGIQALLPYMSKRLVYVSEDDIMNMLNNKDPFIHTFSPDARDAINAIESGSVVFMVHPSSKSQFAGMPATGWKGKVSCHLTLPKEEINAIKNLLLASRAASTTTTTTTTTQSKEEVMEDKK